MEQISIPKSSVRIALHDLKGIPTSSKCSDGESSLYLYQTVHLLIYFRGACDITFIRVGIGHGNLILNPGQGYLFGLVGFNSISTVIGYLMPNPAFTYILDVYDL